MHDDYYEEFQQQVMFRSAVRQLARTKIAPHATDIDNEERFPHEAYAAMRAAGLTGLPHPAELGGGGADLLAQVICIEEIATACATSATILLENWVGTSILLSHGSADLQAQVIPAVNSGEVGSTLRITEQTTASNLAPPETTATPEGDAWVLEGEERLVSNAPRAEWYAIVAKTGHSEYGVFMIHRNDPGVSFRKPQNKMKVSGSPTTDIFLDHCRIPAHQAVGDPNEGHRYITAELDNTLALFAAQALGIAQSALNATVSYTAEKKHFGERLSEIQMIRSIVADMAIKVESSRSLLYDAVESVSRASPHASGRVSMAKLLCSDTAISVTNDAIELRGGRGCMQDYRVERMMRDAKTTHPFGGTNQLQRLLIANSIYGVGEACMLL